MKREHWERVGALFHEALKREGLERDEFLSSLGEEGLEDELRSLLAAHEGRGPFDELADSMTGPEAWRLLRLGPGDPIGPYRIVREIACGGMATVYQGQDPKHERRIAIKVLRPELSAVLGTDRFLHEIRTTARLQHPHILTLLDSGQADGLLYYVMPYIEGETLRSRLNRDKQLGIEEAVRITTEVADALDYAHRHGIIHRDIKPENILLHDGRALVADFGIALAVSLAGDERITETGLSLGTPHYMSPEQATAEREPTHRSDIYGLGCVLYEMLVGEPPHTGSSAQQIMKKIVTEDARPLVELRKSVPPNIAAATAKALERLPADRFESARRFAEALRDPAFRTPTTAEGVGVAQPPKRRMHLTVALVTLALAAALTSVWGWFGPVAREADRPVVEFQLDPPAPNMSFLGLLLSPDGQRLVAVVETGEGSVLYQRMLDARTWEVIPGTTGAYDPFFSPDGEWLGFFSSRAGSGRETALEKVPVGGGPVQTIARFGARFGTNMFACGASWGSDDRVVFTATEKTPGFVQSTLFSVTADGGVPERLTTSSLREGSQFRPHHLSSGDVLLFKNVSASGEWVTALSLESGTTSRLTPGISPLSDRPGRVIYVASDGSVIAQTFNPRTLSLEGSPKRIAEGIGIRWGIALYTVSSDGSLAYLSESGGDQLVLVNREGEERPLYSAGGVSRMAHPRFSPSGDRIAFKRDGDVWVYSLAEGTARRLSFEGPVADPAWTTDGRSIAYSVAGDGDGSFASLHLRAVDGTGSAKRILTGDGHIWQADFAPGDSEVVFLSLNEDRGPPFLFRAPLGSGSGAVPLVETKYYVDNPALSPDGRWLAYTSLENGIWEVYVRSYPDMGPPTVVSIDGGYAPAWSSDGSEIFYWTRSSVINRIMAAALRYDGSRVTVVERTELFRTTKFRETANRNYDVHPSGQEFVMVGLPETRAVWRVNALAGER